MARAAKQRDGILLGRLGEALGFRLRRVQNQLSRDFQDRSKRWDLRSGMFSALEIIRANPGISQTDLAREIGMDKSVIVSLIDDLERRDWTVRERSGTDRRRYQLLITPAGEEAVATLVDNMLHVEHIGLAALTPEEREVLIRALDKVYRAYVRPLA
ncbi:MarR family transcriptional regulator [Sphingomonas sp.]|uniref:MarR family winged helix-turn-helix transcriptional regulator n=1 Tax=Sphingomonas sp. TaxID=28214 RepID=UPI001B2D619A|nr:MarR family transcriptional regulator [Sphingomonas sp.]MBO9714569.1 MarR family transcriptional regulator [Sphingomonas sp.]